ncbi:MAG: membrane protein insertase YidC [Gammaproteobacteria bacterium]
MDNRVLIWMAVAMIWLLTYQAWQRDYGPQRAAAPIEQAVDGATASAPTISDSIAPPTLGDDAVPTGTGIAGPQLEEAPDTTTPKIRVVTDVYDLYIDTTGATLRNVTLNNYPKRKDEPDDKVVLLQPRFTALQTGLLAGAGREAPSHDAVFTASNSSYELSSGQDSLDVTLTWQGDGVSVDKTYTFTRGRYNVELKQVVRNTSDTAWSGAQYAQLKGNAAGTKRSMVDVDSYSFIGSVVYDGDSYEKYLFKDLAKEPLKLDATNGWIANIQHHFLSAAIPPAGELVKYSSRTPNESTMLVSGVTPLKTIAAGGSSEFSQRLFVGPKLQDQMEETAEGLKLSVDYGFLTIISQPMFWLLKKIHDFVGNWGLAIILLTVLIKLLFYPLAEKAGRSTAKMRTVAPRLKQIQERYKDDKQAQSKAMMELYKKEKINPAAGCLPLLIQMPVFLALYWVLIESVELRQAPFFGWITDLSSRDPWFILPLIMAGAMFVQTKLNPASPDPTMQKVMTFMPLIMSVFFMFFPAGLVLYWVVNTVLSVAQQYRINKLVERGA